MLLISNLIINPVRYLINRFRLDIYNTILLFGEADEKHEAKIFNAGQSLAGARRDNQAKPDRNKIKDNLWQDFNGT